MDLTEHERLIQELRRREAYLAEAQRLSHTGSFGWKISTNEIFWSEETFHIFQYDGTIQPTPELIRRRIHPEDERLVEQTFAAASAKGIDVDFEHRLLMPDGSVKHVHVLAHAMQDHSGDTEYVGAIMDISAWRQAEDELRKSEEKYRDLVDLSPDAIYVRDTNGRLISANPAGLELLGCTAEEAAGMSTAESYLPEELALYQERLQNINEGARLRFERTFVRKDGTQVPVEVSSSSMRDGYSQVVMRDISERKRNETVLRRSEAYLAEAQRLSRTGSWAGSADLTASTYWSAEMFRLLGFPVADNPPPNEEAQNRFTPETLARMAELWVNIRQTKTVCDGEFPMRLPDGSDRILRIVAHPVFDEAGDIDEFFGTTIDITEQRQAQAELEKALSEIRKSEDRLRTIIDTIPTMAWSTQPDGAAEFLNRGWLEYTGRSGSEARGWGWKHVVHPEDSEALMDKWLTSIATGNPFEAEARFRRADGQYRWCLCRAVPLRDELGNIVQWYGTSTDIEDRKQAEEIRTAQIHQASTRAEVSAALSRPGPLREILHGCAEALVRHLDAAFARIWTLNKEKNMLELQASAGMYTHLDGPHGRVPVGKLKIGLIAQEKKPYLTNDVLNDLRLGDKDWAQTERMISFAGHPLIVEDRVVGVIAMFARKRLSTLTLETLASVADSIAQGIERKQAEEALRKAQTELAHVTRVMTIGELVASIAHEVNQPLGAIVTNGQACVHLLSRDVPDLERSREVIGRMIKDAMRASEVIKRIRDLMHKTPAEKTTVQINETIEEVVALVSSEVQRSGIELQTELAVELPPVLGDRIQLQQVILNLILNGKDAMSDEQTNPRELKIRTRRSDSGAIVVAVRDTGRGLDAKAVERIFDPFFTTKPEGMGLGLSISRTIIEAHGGTLWATPNDREGATIQFALPPEAARVSREKSRASSTGDR